MNEFLFMLVTCIVYPSWFWMATYRNVTSTVTHVMEFTEECLTVFWTYVYALLCIWFWLLGTWAKITRSRWSYIQTYTFSKWHLTKRAGNMCHNLYVRWYDTSFSKYFQLFSITFFKKQSLIYRNVVFKVTTTDKKGRTLESCISFTSATLKAAISHKIKRWFWCLWYGGPQ